MRTFTLLCRALAQPARRALLVARATSLAVLAATALTTTAAAQTTRVSVDTGGTPANLPSYGASTTYDGRFVVFESPASNLVSGDTNTRSDIFVRDRFEGTTVRVSVANGGVQANGDSYQGRISGDGRYVAFHSLATNLVPGDTNGERDVFVHDFYTKTTTRVSVASDGAQATGGSSYASSISGDGRFIAFQSAAFNLVTNDTNNVMDVFVHDRVERVTRRVSIPTNGVGQATALSQAPSISANGRYVAFESDAPTLVAGDTNGVMDVFVHDRETRETIRASVRNDGSEPTGPSRAASISDRRSVAFVSEDAAMVAGDTNGYQDIFVRDFGQGETTRVNVTTSGLQALNGNSSAPAMSLDGNVIAFESAANNLVPGDGNGVVDVFVRSAYYGSTQRASVGPGAVPAGASSHQPAVSGTGRYVAFLSFAGNLDATVATSPAIFMHDARYFTRELVSYSVNGNTGADGSSRHASLSRDGLVVAFESAATNLVNGDTNGLFDVFAADRGQGGRSRVSVASDGSQGNGGSRDASISGEGRYVAFYSEATNLVPGDTNARPDIFVRDRVRGETTRVSIVTGGGQANDRSELPAISDDGRFVTFQSSATNLYGGDTNTATDVFVHDRVTGITSRVSVALGGGVANGASEAPAISGDGRFVVFRSSASNLVANDTNGQADIFLHDRVTATTTRVSVGAGGAQANGESAAPHVSADGQVVVFESLATNLVAGDTNGQRDVFVRTLATGVTTRMSVSVGGVQATAASFAPRASADGRFIVFHSDAFLTIADSNMQTDAFVYDRTVGTLRRVSLALDESEMNDASLYPAISGDGRTIGFHAFGSVEPYDVNGQPDIILRALTPEIRAVSPRSGAVTGGTLIRIDGAGFLPGTQAYIWSLNDPVITLATAMAADAAGEEPGTEVASPNLLFARTPQAAAGPGFILVGVPGFSEEMLWYSFTFAAPSAAVDTDLDGIPDIVERRYSLDLLDPRDATADPDNDGVSNLQELRDGTHPNGLVTRYLAEGATSTFFTTTLAMTNPGEVDATVLLRFLPASGAPIPHLVTVPAYSRQTVDVGSVAGLANAEFSTVLESDQLVVLDRLMSWDANGYGSTSETAIPSLSTEWFLAEGATHSGLELFYLLQNPHPTAVTATVTFLRPTPLAPIVKQFTLQPQSRFNVWVDVVDPALASTDVSAVVTATQPIAVERALYLSRPGQLFTAGHESAGVTAPSLTWFLAEGATGPYFDEFVLLANPAPTAARARVTFLKPDGSTVVQFHDIAPQSRSTIWVDYADPSLADTAVSTTVEVTNNVAIVVERALWWPGDASRWYEAHNSPGATSTGQAWIVASGVDGGPADAETFVLVANTADIPAEVRVTVLFEDATSVVRTFNVNARSRFNVEMRAEFPAVAGRRFGVQVESIGLGNAPIVVESAIYGDAFGLTWHAGANALATKLR